MSQQFVNREEELKFLTNRLNSDMSEFIVFIGRRRVGKSELVTNFINKNNGIYYLSSKEGDKENIKNFSIEISRFLNDENFSKVIYENWYDLFNSLRNNVYFKKKSEKNKIIIAIDEFPYLIYSNNSISSIFQKIWDEILKHENILFIILGSSISIMESEVLAYKSPLYGRRTGQWEVLPLEINHFNSFYPKLSFEERLKIWFCLGGIPEYLKKFSDGLSIYENIKRHILEKGNYLSVDAELILNEEFKETKNYKLILKSISFGNTTMGNIVNDTGLDKSMVSKYLDVLENIKLIKGELPVISKTNARGNKYYINDNYFNFWFKYYYKNRTNLEILRSDNVIKLIEKDFDRHCGMMFERFILRYLPFFIKDFNYEKLGKQWGSYTSYEKNNLTTKSYEIDVCAINNDSKEILFSEVKWQNDVDGEKLLYELKQKAKLVKWNNEHRSEKYVLFAKSFKNKNLDGCECFDLTDLENILN